MATVIGPKSEASERQRLLNTLLDAVKQCQIRFGGRSELATESDDHVSVLCNCLEIVLSHGLRTKPLSKSSALKHVSGIVSNPFRYTQDPPCFWHYAKEYLTKHELERFGSLKKVFTDTGRGRAWLRSALNEKSLNRYFQCLVSNPTQASVYYYDWAILLDQELNSMLPTMASGLGPILFAINIDDAKFNKSNESSDDSHLSRSEPILAVNVEDTENNRRRHRRAPAHIVSFDNDRDEESSSDSTSAPPYLSSSVQSASYLASSPNTQSFTYDNIPAVSPTSSNDSSQQENVRQDSVESRHTLTPVTDTQIGELILISAVEEVVVEQDDLSVGSASVSHFGAISNNLDESKNLSEALERSKEQYEGMKIKMKSVMERGEFEKSKLEHRLQELTRENEVLKHQLRKYVGAVQLLNRDGLAHEALACLEASKDAIQDREEAAQYEHKLVQVAEMHGELMEFNERLHRLVTAKERLILRLERELTDLRGPLPGAGLTEDLAVPDALVNIWVPSAFLTGGSSDVHHVYQVYVRIRDIEWNIYRRYTQFYALHKQLKKLHPVIATYDFPPKKTIGNKDAKFVEDRRQRLQRYLRQVVDVVSRARSDLSDPASFVSIIPFFGQESQTEEITKAKTTSKSAFSRRAREPVVDHTQYNGL